MHIKQEYCFEPCMSLLSDSSINRDSPSTFFKPVLQGLHSPQSPTTHLSLGAAQISFATIIRKIYCRLLLFLSDDFVGFT